MAAPTHPARRGEDDRRFRSAALWTVLAAVVPGTGLWRAGRRWIGGVLTAVWAATLATVAALALLDRPALLGVATDASRLTLLAGVALGAAVIWVVSIVATHLLLRPDGPSLGQRLGGGLLVGVASFAVAVPSVLAANVALSTADGLGVFNQTSATTPKIDAVDPWKDKNRLNILLLGDDGGTGRDIRLGVRPDSVMLLSIDTHTGASAIFNLPRQTAKMPFPSDSPLHRYYPDGFYDGVSGLNQDYALNALYNNVPARVPKSILGTTSNLGADVTKIAVGEALGLKVDYYVLVNMDGFKDIINAIGGITVNVNDRVPIGGRNASAGHPAVKPTGWIEIGENKHLDGRLALWFGRGRYATTDYKRMSRQRCVIQAVVKQADPATVLANYQALIAAGTKTIRTDVPSALLPDLAGLALKVRAQPMRSILFDQSVGFRSWDPDWPAVRKLVAKTLKEAGASSGASSASAGPSPSAKKQTSANLDDECAYHPGS